MNFHHQFFKSCWLVIPLAQTVIVYVSMEQAKTFIRGELVDDVMGIKLFLS